MADIFISYKREEAGQAGRLAHVLEQFGYSVWWDVALLSGDEYRDVIAEMIDKCAAVIVLWSPLAVRSTFVRSEASYAQRQDKLLPGMLKLCSVGLQSVCCRLTQQVECTEQSVPSKILHELD